MKMTSTKVLESTWDKVPIGGSAYTPHGLVKKETQNIGRTKDNRPIMFSERSRVYVVPT